MTLHDLALLRNEILLTLVIVVLLCLDLFRSSSSRKRISVVSAILMTAVCIVGFLPQENAHAFGGMFQSSALIAMMKNILNIGTLIVILQSADWLGQEENYAKSTEFTILLLSTLMGMSFMVSAGHFLMLMLGLELATIPIAALVAFEKGKVQSAEAGIKLILLAALSSGVMLFGISLIYGSCGSLLFSECSTKMVGGGLQALAFIFFMAGLAFKISLVPFHLWTADVYEGAPINISSYLSVVSKGAAVFIFLITLFSVFQTMVSMWTELLVVLAVLSMTIGNLFAIRQQNLKRFLAFSSIAQAGFLMLGVLSATQLGMTSVLYFVLVYIFSNLAAFGVVAVISAKTGKETIDDYNGLYTTNPMLSLTMMLALFSLAGIPPAAGFFGKLFLFMAVAQKGMVWLLIVATLNATISLYYYLLVVKAMFINANDKPIEHFKSSPFTRMALVLCVGGIIVIGFASMIFDTMYSLSKGI